MEPESHSVGVSHSDGAHRCLKKKTRPCPQIDGGLRAPGEGLGESGRVLPQVQLLALGGGGEEAGRQDAVRRPPRPGRHAGSRQHH